MLGSKPAFDSHLLRQFFGGVPEQIEIRLVTVTLCWHTCHKSAALQPFKINGLADWAGFPSLSATFPRGGSWFWRLKQPSAGPL